MNSTNVLTTLARHALANSERVITTISVVKDAEFITIHGHQPHGLVNITIPESIETMINTQPETTPPGKISLDELRLTAARDALQGLLDNASGGGSWRRVAISRIAQIDAQLEQMAAKRLMLK